MVQIWMNPEARVSDLGAMLSTYMLELHSSEQVVLRTPLFHFSPISPCALLTAAEFRPRLTLNLTRVSLAKLVDIGSTLEEGRSFNQRRWPFFTESKIRLQVSRSASIRWSETIVLGGATFEPGALYEEVTLR